MQRLAQTRFTLQIDARLSRTDGGPALRARPVDARFAGAYGVDPKRASTVSLDVVAVPGPGVEGEGEE